VHFGCHMCDIREVIVYMFMIGVLVISTNSMDKHVAQIFVENVTSSTTRRAPNLSLL
jgi:hypothetical protein